MEQITIKMYGHIDCDDCALAKEKLDLLGLPYYFYIIEEFINLHTGWKIDGSVDLLAMYSKYETLPIMYVNGEFYNYPLAMRAIKELLKERTGK